MNKVLVVRIGHKLWAFGEQREENGHSRGFILVRMFGPSFYHFRWMFVLSFAPNPGNSLRVARGKVSREHIAAKRKLFSNSWSSRIVFLFWKHFILYFFLAHFWKTPQTSSQWCSCLTNLFGHLHTQNGFVPLKRFDLEWSNCKFSFFLFLEFSIQEYCPSFKFLPWFDDSKHIRTFNGNVQVFDDFLQETHWHLLIE